ncbi:glycosyl transferases group 1 family protein [Lyngbya aestuarii BL J]|uniref:Glycosyl transferases group 1 family protein n=1 Tax=Lyngbya aestuarii BL J TaxID=1348334 RepID=U7QCD8_9CYAN|nr:glycosyltransferase [Lyngbya aestuarii]ERT04700.1 glycosyl transferases group 1 family protein [Lyngbya aestuarii BL J]
MIKYYIFFTRRVMPQTNVASLVQVAHSANAAANLGYPTVLAYLAPSKQANPIELLKPFQPRKPDEHLSSAYNLKDRLKVAPLPTPWPIDQTWGGKWTSSNTIISKYYFPVHIFPKTQLIHTRDWNCVKTAIKAGIPVIYEQHHYNETTFPAEIVRSPLFQVAITVADNVRESLIEKGMPSEKTVKLHNGFNQGFLTRHSEEAQAWRQQILQNNRQHLVVYAGGLYQFKGVDFLLDVAQKLPEIQFAFAGGDLSQVEAYRVQAQEKQASNAVFLGHLPQNKLASLLQAADILAHPHCMTPAATFTSPLKFFDYMASGTPIVATEIPPLKEFKSLKMAAGWCEPDQVDPFVQTLQQVLSKYPRKIEGYTESMESVSQFSWENRIKKIMTYVQESVQPQFIR